MPKSYEINPLWGKPLRYLIGSSINKAGRGEVLEVSYDIGTCEAGSCIAYCNLFDEKNSKTYGPYLHNSDTAQQYNEGQIDPSGPGWNRNLHDQFERRRQQGFRYIELDNPDAYRTSDVLRAVTLGATYNLQTIAKNPGICERPLDYIRHPSIVGIIVEKDAGTPQDMDSLRTQAGKPGLPIWFVSFGLSGLTWAKSLDVSRYQGMGVTNSVGGEYTDSIDIHKPRIN